MAERCVTYLILRGDCAHGGDALRTRASHAGDNPALVTCARRRAAPQRRGAHRSAPPRAAGRRIAHCACLLRIFAWQAQRRVQTFAVWQTSARNGAHRALSRVWRQDIISAINVTSDALTVSPAPPKISTALSFALRAARWRSANRRHHMYAALGNGFDQTFQACCAARLERLFCLFCVCCGQRGAGMAWQNRKRQERQQASAQSNGDDKKHGGAGGSGAAWRCIARQQSSTYWLAKTFGGLPASTIIMRRGIASASGMRAHLQASPRAATAEGDLHSDLCAGGW